MKNKKAQIDIITLIVVIIGIIIAAVVMLKIFNSVVGGISQNIAPLSSEANKSITQIDTFYNNFIDQIAVFFIVLNIILLLVFSFFIDAHPAFLILYIFSAALSIMILPFISDIAIRIYGSEQFATEMSKLTFTSFVLNHLNMITLAVIFVTGIIIYAKFRGSSQPMG